MTETTEQRIAPLSLLRLKLHTGHKHQLRVHLAHCLKGGGFSSPLFFFLDFHLRFLLAPILGDTLYSSKPISEAIAQISPVPEGRIFLHASEISILVSLHLFDQASDELFHVPIEIQTIG